MPERGLALFDIDQTLYDGFMLLNFANYQAQEGMLAQESLSVLQKDLSQYQHKELDYETFAKILLVDWARGLRGLSYTDVLRQARQFLQGEKNNFYPFTKGVTRLVNKTHDIYLVTGEPQFLAEATAELYPTSGYIASGFEVKDDFFTGKVSRALARREDKLTALNNLLEKYPLHNSLAFGDSEGDIAMLEVVGHPFCINPSEGLRIHATNNNWSVLALGEVETAVDNYLSQQNN